MTQKTLLQDTYMGILQKEETPVAIFLISGVRLRGKITSYDKKSVTLADSNGEQLIYKRSISTIMPEATVKGL